MNVRMLMSTGRKIAVCALCAGLLGGTLGGCNNKAKEQQELALQENTTLRDQNNQLSTALATAQAQLAQCMDEKSKTASTDTGGGWSDDTGGGSGGGYQAEPVTITVAGDVLFDSGKATLKQSAKSKLDDVARTIRSNYGGSRVRVEGYTDSDPIRKSKWGSNEALSQARADAVRDYLASKGISRISAVGMGSANPKSTKAASRRVEIVISG